MLLRICSILLLALPAVVLAQEAPNNSMPGMNHLMPTPIIDGSVNPEKIPDVTAYRLWFIATGELPNPTEAKKARQLAHLHRIQGFHEADADVLIRVLEDFKVRWGLMKDAYNAQVDAAVKAGKTLPDVKAFLAARDQLVNDTRARLKLALSEESLSALDAHIQKEKHGMKMGLPMQGGGQ
jgi:hypothetical protein